MQGSSGIDMSEGEIDLFNLSLPREIDLQIK